MKRYLVLTIFLVVSFSIMAASVLLPDPSQERGIETIKEIVSGQNHIGDLRFNFKDYEEAAPARQAPPATESGETVAPVPERIAGEANPLRSRIEQKYTARLQSIGSLYESKLDGLVTAALKELAAVRKDNPNADITPLINKYYAAGKALEAECDSQIYAVLESFESELQANSFPPDAALNARQIYEARKSSKAAQITAAKP
ncbi:MAG: hypothetical protein K6T65_08950 [Peptococcaceae bacterium]|nr:hypothetical protein [Peptococcaceae bacterium]